MLARSSLVRQPYAVTARAWDSFEETETALSDRFEALPIGEFWSYPQSRSFAELLIDCEEDRTLRAELVGTLREEG